MVNLEHDWLMMMSLGVTVVSFFRVTSWYTMKPSVSVLDFGFRFLRDFRTLDYS